MPDASFGPFVSFFLSISCFIITNKCIQVLFIYGKAATMETGPNDAKRIVWAIREVFIYLSHVLLLLTSVFRYYLSTGRLRYRDHENGPKRRETRRLGHSQIFSFFLSCFTYTDKCTLLFTFVHFCALNFQQMLLLTFWALYHKQTQVPKSPKSLIQ